MKSAKRIWEVKMLVKNYMTTEVITTNEEESLLQAAENMRGYKHHALPVVDDMKRVRGILFESDVTKACPADMSLMSRQEINSLMGRFRVKNLMHRDAVCLRPDDSVEFAAYQFYKYDYACFPVVDTDNRLAGILSKKDIFRAFVEIMAMNRACTRFTIETPDKVGVVAELAMAFKNANLNILSLVPRVLPDGTATINIRADIGDQGLGPITTEITSMGYKILDVNHYDAVK